MGRIYDQEPSAPAGWYIVHEGALVEFDCYPTHAAARRFLDRMQIEGYPRLWDGDAWHDPRPEYCT